MQYKQPGGKRKYKMHYLESTNKQNTPSLSKGKKMVTRNLCQGTVVIKMRKALQKIEQTVRQNTKKEVKRPKVQVWRKFMKERLLTQLDRINRKSTRRNIGSTT